VTAVTDGPSNGELGRLIGDVRATLDSRFGELNTRLDKMVSLDVYTIQTTHVGERIAQLQTETQRCMDAIAKVEDDIEAYQREEARRRDAERQARLYQLIVPVAICIISSVIAIWAVVAK